MTIALKITKIGSSLATILPKELLTGLNAEKGDIFYATPEGDGFRVTRANPDFDAVMAAAATVERRYANVLKALADK